ncbi:hypothetical protein P8452_38288 [Trifolium repens]|nr:hypothetical protein P8452_38288 [Trifolium repens]
MMLLTCGTKIITIINKIKGIKGKKRRLQTFSFIHAFSPLPKLSLSQILSPAAALALATAVAPLSLSHLYSYILCFLLFLALLIGYVSLMLGVRFLIGNEIDAACTECRSLRKKDDLIQPLALKVDS